MYLVEVLTVKCSADSMRSMVVLHTCQLLLLNLHRNLSKKYQPKKKEEDENKYVSFISLILDVFGLNQHHVYIHVVSHTDDVLS